MEASGARGWALIGAVLIVGTAHSLASTVLVSPSCPWCLLPWQCGQCLMAATPTLWVTPIYLSVDLGRRLQLRDEPAGSARRVWEGFLEEAVPDNGHELG